MHTQRDSSSEAQILLSLGLTSISRMESEGSEQLLSQKPK